MPVVGRVGAIRSAVINQHQRLLENGKPLESRFKQQLREKRDAQRRLRRRKANRENIGACGNKKHDALAKWCRRLRDQKWFQYFMIAIIVAAGVLVGVQTYFPRTDNPSLVISVLDYGIVVIFVLEILVKVLAEGRRPHRFFLDGWNVFDFLIVVVGFMPFGGSAVTAFRLVRLLRVLKLVRALPKLRILVLGLVASLSSIAYIGLLLLLLFYLYAVLGVSLFGDNDPVQMGTLHIAVLTLFRCATLEDWSDVMYTAMYGCAEYGYENMADECTNSSGSGVIAVVYFVSFVVVSSMMILNLFIGVITSSMQEAKASLSEERDENETATDEDELMEQRLNELSELMARITDEVEHFAQLEKERKANDIIRRTMFDLETHKQSMDTGSAVFTTAGEISLPLLNASHSSQAQPQEFGSSHLVTASAQVDLANTHASLAATGSTARSRGTAAESPMNVISSADFLRTLASVDSVSPSNRRPQGDGTSGRGAAATAARQRSQSAAADVPQPKTGHVRSLGNTLSRSPQRLRTVPSSPRGQSLRSSVTTTPDTPPARQISSHEPHKSEHSHQLPGAIRSLSPAARSPAGKSSVKHQHSGGSGRTVVLPPLEQPGSATDSSEILDSPFATSPGHTRLHTSTTHDSQTSPMNRTLDGKPMMSFVGQFIQEEERRAQQGAQTPQSPSGQSHGSSVAPTELDNMLQSEMERQARMEAGDSTGSGSVKGSEKKTDDHE